MSVLFSPVGTADPLSLGGDGPFIHLVRVLKPKFIYIFLTAEMKQHEEKDSRYTWVLNKLIASLDDYAPTIEIVDSQLEEVHLHDQNIVMFREALDRIEEKHPLAEILLNIGSGTPAMKSALSIIDAFGFYRSRAFQVPDSRETREKSFTDKRENPRGYDAETLWELNPDNGEKFVNRVVEIKHENFSSMMVRNNVRLLIEKYEYEAAYRLAKTDRSFPVEAVSLIRGANLRVSLQHAEAIPFFKGTAFEYNTEDQLREYLQVLEVKLKKKMWLDFVRAVTPAFTETLYKILHANVPPEKYLNLKDQNDGSRKIDYEKLKQEPRIFDHLDSQTKQRLNNDRDDKYFFNGELVQIIRNNGFFALEHIKKMTDLLEWEKTVRNVAAHQIVEFSPQIIQKNGLDPKKVLDYLFQINGVKHGSYDRLNSKILSVF